MEPLTVYASPSSPKSTDFGNGIFDGNLPAGWSAVIQSQPANGTVTIYGSSSWRIETPPIPELASGNIADSWSWKATDGTNFTEPFIVPLDIANAD